VGASEPTLEDLTGEAIKLLSLELDQLYATLGAQLLGYSLPSRVAGMVSYLSAVQRAGNARVLFESLPVAPQTEWGSGVGFIYDRLNSEGVERFAEMRADLENALCKNEEILRLSDEVNRSLIQILITVVGATLRMPKTLDPVSVTVVALLLKIGVRKFCAGSSVQSSPKN
jgi:hypothetical protein